MKIMLNLYIIEKVIRKKERFTMIYKVFYQESKTEVPVREHTKTLFIEAESERDVRSKLKDKPYNIEFVTAVDSKYLEFEKQNEDFKVLEIE